MSEPSNFTCLSRGALFVLADQAISGYEKFASSAERSLANGNPAYASVAAALAQSKLAYAQLCLDRARSM